MKLTTLEIEIAVSKYFGIRENLVVPNISWGMALHECDLLVLTKTDCASEIEIKTTLADIKKDKEKGHGHFSHKIKYLYFAIPKELTEKAMEYIPDRAGILQITKEWKEDYTCEIAKFSQKAHWNIGVENYRKAKKNSDYKFTKAERIKMAELGTMRIWGLKKKLQQAKYDQKNK